MLPKSCLAQELEAGQSEDKQPTLGRFGVVPILLGIECLSRHHGTPPEATMGTVLLWSVLLMWLALLAGSLCEVADEGNDWQRGHGQ